MNTHSERQNQFLNSKHTNSYLKESMRLQLSIRALERKANLKKTPSENAMEIIQSCEESMSELIKQGYPNHHKDVQFYKKLINSVVKFV